MTSHSTTTMVPANTACAIKRALKALTEISLLVSKQKRDPFSGRTNTSGERPTPDRRMEQVPYTPDSSKPVLAVPCSTVSDLLALAHTLYSYGGVGAILALERDHFDWPAIEQDTGLDVLPCCCNRRKPSVEPW